MKRWVASLLTLGIAGDAAALSCMPYSPMHAYHKAAEAEEPYVIVTGRLDFDKTRLPQVDWSNQQEVPPITRIPARITGQALTRSGFGQDFTSDIILEVVCLGPWCSSVSTDETYLTFLERRENGYVLATDPCAGFALAQADKAVLTQIETCFRGGACPKPAP